MLTLSNKLDLSDQNIFVNFDLHLKNWSNYYLLQIFNLSLFEKVLILRTINNYNLAVSEDSNQLKLFDL